MRQHQHQVKGKVPTGPEKSWNWTLVLKKSWILLLSAWKTKIMNLQFFPVLVAL